METIIIGLMGMPGAGKETVTDFFRELIAPRSLHSMKFSDILRETLELWNIPFGRVNLQNVGSAMREAFGQDALVRATQNRLEHLQIKTDVLILDSIRLPQEDEMVRSLPNSYVIYVDVPQEIRYQRVRDRVEKVDDSTKTWEEFQREERHPNDVQILDLCQKANFRIDNVGDLDSLRKQIEEIWRTIQRDHG